MQSKPYNVHRLHEWSSPFVPRNTDHSKGSSYMATNNIIKKDLSSIKNQN
ncbi:hypothetical protein Hanom_Chr01g00077541 [Helianthus anomalus]